MKAALQKLHELGVAKWAVIHCPELGCGMDEAGNYCEFESLKLPKGYIKGTVGAGDAFCAGVLYAAETDMPLRGGAEARRVQRGGFPERGQRVGRRENKGRGFEAL
ncbi:MAG: PfkB family carbohydrate kinase [Acutalibacteraceae bacterium]